MPATQPPTIRDIARLLPRTGAKAFGPAAVRLAFEGLRLLQQEIRSGPPRRARAASRVVIRFVSGLVRHGHMSSDEFWDAEAGFDDLAEGLLPELDLPGDLLGGGGPDGLEGADGIIDAELADELASCAGGDLLEGVGGQVGEPAPLAPRSGGRACRPPRGPTASAPRGRSAPPSASSRRGSRPRAAAAITSRRSFVWRTSGAATARHAGDRVEGVEQRPPCPPAGRGCTPAAAPSPARAVAAGRRSTRPVLPRVSSSTSGFFLCGMMLDPVQNASGRSRKLNSVVDQITHSSAQPLRCIAISDRSEDELQQEVAVAGHVEAVARRPRRSRASAAPTRGRWAATCRPAPRPRAAARSRACGSRPAARGRAGTSRRRRGSSGPRAPAGPAAGACSPGRITSALALGRLDERPSAGRRAARRVRRWRRGPRA